MLKINLSKVKKSRFKILIVFLVFIIYGNSINNEYAMDDNLVAEGVSKVEKGISGITEIFTTSVKLTMYFHCHNQSNYNQTGACHICISHNTYDHQLKVYTVSTNNVVILMFLML